MWPVVPADAEISSSEAVAAVVVEVAEVAAGLAGYGHQLGAGSTAAGPGLRLRLRYLASRRKK